MKVLIWNTNFIQDGGGSQKVTYFLANRLEQFGLETTIACNKVGTQRENPVFRNLSSKVKLYQDTFGNPWESSESTISFFSRMLAYIRAAIRFFSFLRKERFSLVHLNYVSWDICFLGLFKYLLGFPLVISFLGGENNLAPQEKLTKIKMRFALRVANKVTVASKYLCDEFEKDFGFANALYIPFYINPSELLKPDFLLPSIFMEDHFVFCGRISSEKRVPFLVKAFQKAITGGCCKKLYIVGDGKDLLECRQIVKNFKIEEHVVFLGQLPYQTSLQIISRCRCLILCSRTESNPQVVLEAMSLKKPVICSLLPGVKQIVLHEKTGLLFDETREDILVESILKISKDHHYAQNMGDAAYALVKVLFAKQDYAKQMVAVYSKLIPNIVSMDNENCT